MTTSQTRPAATGVRAWTPAQRFAAVFGVVYLLVGVAGFALTGVHDFAGEHHHTLLIFAVNPLHNVIHLVAGASSGWRPPRGTAPPGWPTSSSASSSAWSPCSASSAAWACSACPGSPTRTTSSTWPPRRSSLYFGSVAAGGTGRESAPDLSAGVACATPAAGRNTGGTRATTRGAEFTVPKQGGTHGGNRTTAR